MKKIIKPLNVRDERPKKGLWAPGHYVVRRHECNEYFTGDKNAIMCAPCAYKDDKKVK